MQANDSQPMSCARQLCRGSSLVSFRILVGVPNFIFVPSLYCGHQCVRAATFIFTIVHVFLYELRARACKSFVTVAHLMKLLRERENASTMYLERSAEAAFAIEWSATHAHGQNVAQNYTCKQHFRNNLIIKVGSLEGVCQNVDGIDLVQRVYLLYN